MESDLHAPEINALRMSPSVNTPTTLLFASFTMRKPLALSFIDFSASKMVALY